ncbi:S8 family serine peptidase [Haladaptatus sp. DYSN1]|uniref:S8 family peptidase n=1 Tax=unclassified Haladaptatus TaxID=2622732 RepID=UPI00240559D9|nr:S8 family serine peptidase [Haladaptatus sp. DYSN1]
MARHNTPRRTFLKGIGAAGLGTTLASGSAGASLPLVDDLLDLTSDDAQEVLVVFDQRENVSLLSQLDLLDGFVGMNVFPIGYTRLTGSQIEEVASWDSVRRIEANKELDYHNADAREVTGVSTVQSDLGYKGDNAHTAVIDSGISALHPDHQENLQHNYRYLNPLGSSGTTFWVDVGSIDTDDNGHGTHTSGSIAGDGSNTEANRGMAPSADLTVYSAGLTLLVIHAVSAMDHLVSEKLAGNTDVQVVSNSYGSASGNDYDPDAALNVATWEAFEAGILPVFSAGNSGPANSTLNDYAKAPHVLSVAATNDQKAVTDFSSRGRASSYAGETNYDRQTALDNLRAHHDGESVSGPVGLYRNGVGAPGNAVVSTLSPLDPLNATGGGNDLYYGPLSGTSMSCPVTAGIATLVVDAYYDATGSYPDPLDVLNTIEAESNEVRADYTPANIGAGFVDGDAAVTRAANGNLADFSEVDIVSE